MAQPTMTRDEIRRLLVEELPSIVQIPGVRRALDRTYAQRKDVRAILEHLDALREDFNRQMAESARRQVTFEQRMEILREDFNRQMAEFARRQDTFEQRMEALREDFNRQMAEFARRQEEHSQRMAEFARRQDAFDQRMEALREDFNRAFTEFGRRLDEHIRRVESHISAIGARWGVMAEEAFRAGLASILDDRVGMKVERFWQVDTEGKVFGRPDKVGGG